MTSSIGTTPAKPPNRSAPTSGSPSPGWPPCFVRRHHHRPSRPDQRAIGRSRNALLRRQVTRLAWRPLRRLPYDRRSSASAPRHATAAPPRSELSLALLGDTQRVLTASTHTLSSARYGT